MKWTRTESGRPFFLDYRPGWMESVPQRDLENSLENIYFLIICFDIKGELLFEFDSK